MLRPCSLSLPLPRLLPATDLAWVGVGRKVLAHPCPAWDSFSWATFTWGHPWVLSAASSQPCCSCSLFPCSSSPLLFPLTEVRATWQGGSCPGLALLSHFLFHRCVPSSVTLLIRFWHQLPRGCFRTLKYSRHDLQLEDIKKYIPPEPGAFGLPLTALITGDTFQNSFNMPPTEVSRTCNQRQTQ